MTLSSKGPRRKKGWGLLSPHGRVLIYVAVNPGSTREEIARGLQITERSAWGIIRDLQTTDAIRPRRDNGSLYYSVNLGAPLWEPMLSGHTVRSIVREFARGGRSGHGHGPP
jgi:predicted transcriptional regulator